MLIDSLEHGALDQVSLAFAGDAGMEVLCVVHRLSRQLAEDADLLSHFRERAALARRLSHSSLVVTHAVGLVDREPFIAQEFVEGHDLADVWARCFVERVRIPVEVALYIVSQVARGLAYAHEFEGLHLVHGNIVPAKIRLAYSGDVKLLGFGLTGCRSKPSDAAPPARGRERSVYRAPEAETARSLDRRADLYALGVILWELLTQRRFDETANPQAPSLVNPMVPVALDRIVAKAIARNVKERFQSASELREAIGERLPSAFNIEWMLSDLLAKLYDVPQEREDRRVLIAAGGAVRARHPTGQNPLRTPPPILNGASRPEDEPPAPSKTPAPVFTFPERRGPLPKRHTPSFSRARRYRLRVVASAALVALCLMTAMGVVVALRYAAEHAGVADGVRR